MKEKKRQETIRTGPQHIHFIHATHYHWNATCLHQHEIDANYWEGVKEMYIAS